MRLFLLDQYTLTSEKNTGLPTSGYLTASCPRGCLYTGLSVWPKSKSNLPKTGTKSDVFFFTYQNEKKKNVLGYQAIAILILNMCLSHFFFIDQNCVVQCVNGRVDGKTEEKQKLRDLRSCLSIVAIVKLGSLAVQYNHVELTKMQKDNPV